MPDKIKGPPLEIDDTIPEHAATTNEHDVEIARFKAIVDLCRDGYGKTADKDRMINYLLREKK